MKKTETYAAAYAELQKILGELDQGEIDVDELGAKVRRAAELIDFCRRRLRETELQVKKVMDRIETDSSKEAGEDQDEE